MALSSRKIRLIALAKLPFLVALTMAMAKPRITPRAIGKKVKAMPMNCLELLLVIQTATERPGGTMESTRGGVCCRRSKMAFLAIVTVTAAAARATVTMRSVEGRRIKKWSYRLYIYIYGVA